MLAINQVYEILLEVFIMNFRQKLLAAATVVGTVATAIYSAADEETYADTAGVGTIGGLVGGAVTLAVGAVVNAAVNYFTSEEDEDFVPENDSDSSEFDEDINAKLEDGEYQQLMIDTTQEPQQLMLEGPQQPLMLTWLGDAANAAANVVENVVENAMGRFTNENGEKRSARIANRK